MIVLAKFVRNDNPRSRNLLITKTFGKFGAPDRQSLATMEEIPYHDEWWYCDVVREIGAGTDRGLFILKPLRRVPMIEQNGQRTHKLTYLYAGAYHSKRVGTTLLIYPKKKESSWHDGPHWILPSAMRRHFLVTSRKEGSFEINSVLVVHDNAEDWPKEFVGRHAPVIVDDAGRHAE